jgi:hypothetical protein
MKSEQPMQKSREGTIYGIIALLCSVIPIVGIAIGYLVFRTHRLETNANTCAIISMVPAFISTIIALVIVGFYACFLWLLSQSY